MVPQILLITLGDLSSLALCRTRLPLTNHMPLDALASVLLILGNWSRIVPEED